MLIRNTLVPRLLASTLAFLGPLVLSAQTAPQSRIRTAIADTDRGSVNETVPGRAKLSADLGEAPSDRTLSSVSLHFSLTDAQQADLTQLLADQQNPSSAHYHQWLTPQQYGARFGLTGADLTKVQAWLTGKGFKVVEVAPSQNFITVSGSVGQIETAFNTRIHSFSENGERHISNVSDPQLPSAISKILTGITGLNDFTPHSRAIVRPRFTSSTTGTHYLAPGDFYTIYNINPLAQQSITGSGITIAILGQTDISLSDVAAFRSASGLAANPPKVIQATGYSAGSRSDGDTSEAQLDVEWSGAIAPRATIDFVTVGANPNAGVFDALTYAVANNIAPIISVSYGGCESASGQSALNSLNQVLQQANAQGITFVGPTGDSGATDCDTAGIATGGLAVDFPASSPFATAVGGTMFNEGNATGQTPYWNSNSSATTGNAGSALMYIPEVPWNESTSTGLDAGGAGGGGVSSYFAKPTWQVANGVPADSSRDIPDLSFAAASNHDGYLFCSQGSCTNGFRDTAGNLNVVGGTSASTPNFAGILALLEQKLGTGPLGNIGPKLYGLASIPNVYQDITSGNNAVACTQGTPNCPNGGSIGYNAAAGYDLATGLGSLNVANFVSNWAAAVPVGAGSGINPQCQLNGNPAVVCQTNTSITPATANNVTCGLNSTSVGFNVAVILASGYSSAASQTPTGTVQLYVDNKAVGAPVALNGGSASLTLDTTTLSSGQHNVSAVYAGDSTFAASKGSLQTNINNTGLVTPIDVVSATSADFSITPCSGLTTVSSGTAAAAVTLSVTPANGFTGTVNLAASSDTGDALGYAFSVKPVNITSPSGVVTTQFVLTATVPRTAAAAKMPYPSDGHGSSGKAPWYAAGSGATFACILLVAVPRRRRLGTLFALLVSVAIAGAAGCGGSGASSSTTPSGGSSTTQPAASGIYNITITATSGTLVHSTVLTYKIQ